MVKVQSAIESESPCDEFKGGVVVDGEEVGITWCGT